MVRKRLETLTSVERMLLTNPLCVFGLTNFSAETFTRQMMVVEFKVNNDDLQGVVNVDLL